MYSGYCACCEPNPSLCLPTSSQLHTTNRDPLPALLPSELLEPLMEALTNDSRMLLTEVIATLRVLT